MITATMYRRVIGHRAEQILWRLSEKVPYGYNDAPDPDKMTEFIITSAIDVFPSGPETYIFAADKTGEIIDFEHMPGSFRGRLDHDAAIIGAGWAVQMSTTDPTITLHQGPTVEETLT